MSMFAPTINPNLASQATTQSPVQGQSIADLRLPPSEALKMVGGFLTMAERMVSGEDPAQVVSETLAKGVMALGGVPSIRKMIMDAALKP